MSWKHLFFANTFDRSGSKYIRLLERAKALGDYLIVGVTADDFDKTRGKINVQQSLMERIDGVKSTGLADEIIVEEYEGQKIDIYVPAPWWKTDYFELRYENAADNRRYFYQLDGEGIRYELVAFVRAIDNGRMAYYIEEYISEAISSVLSDFHNGIDVVAINN